jgi:hypothetical protein
MKKLLLLVALMLSVGVASAQTFRPNVVKGNVKIKNEDALKVKLRDSNLSGDYSVDMTIRTPALQLTFTQVEKINGDWKLTTPIYVGYSYIFSYANGVVHQDSSITVENHFFFGAGANFGVKPDLENGGALVGSVPVGAIVGYSRYGGFIGYDVINNKPMLGVSINLLNVPILQGTTRFSIKN